MTPPPTKRRSLADLVTEQLRADIIGGTYAPGQRLVEERLSQVYAVSRIPVREALKALESEGLVMTTASRARIVTRLSTEEMGEIAPLRRLVEGMAAERAARELSEESRAALTDLVHRGQRALAADDGATLREVNAAIHAAVVAASGSATLFAVHQPLLARTSWSNRSLLHGDRNETWREHVQIVAAICEGDPVRARRLVEEHIDQWLTAAELSDEPGPEEEA
ncbi:GntR family transcriptional regulator [Kineococcus rhizosphaerae]|uniref:GntR family transcriptional regulator n=1 Tax=Kineococcus rhizosphaerae TaxID=559628 RepID=A0A2T0QY28_9ACTN|nr:GntR family transcriptional regulator [Kineococcus rhizosphaerae]PRY11097.1 GntR family transcriptional regulator [Kineococcus rhizosphaerae]